MSTNYYDLYVKDDEKLNDSDISNHVVGGTIKLTNTDIAARFLRIAVLAICYFVVEILAKVLTVAQLIFVVWQRRPNPKLQRLGAVVASYIHDLWRYCTFASDQAPWPFKP